MLQYLLRDILQFDKSLEEAMQRMSSAKRTCNLILGVGDGKVIVLPPTITLYPCIALFRPHRLTSSVELNILHQWQTSSLPTTSAQQRTGTPRYKMWSTGVRQLIHLLIKKYLTGALKCVAVTGRKQTFTKLVVSQVCFEQNIHTD